MKLLFVIGSILIPILMSFIQIKWKVVRVAYDTIATLAALIFGNIAAISIYQIIKDDTVFMTNIHGLFLNPYFLATGAYLGVYIVYILIQNIFIKKETV